MSVEALNEKTQAPAAGADDRAGKRKSFARTGSLLAGAIAVSFALLYGAGIYQLDFWKHYFFHDSIEIGAGCEVRTVASGAKSFPEAELEGAAWSGVAVPHPLTTILPKLAQGQTAFIEYRCKVTLPKGDGLDRGMAYVHLGWVYGDDTSVLLNGTVRATQLGADKISIPLTRDDVQADVLELRVRTQTKSDPFVGLRGQSPAVVSFGSQKNSKILGLSLALQQTKGLFNILPVLTMGIFIIFGWFSGFRSRLVVATLLYFLMVTARNLLMILIDFLPWDVGQTYVLYRAFDAPVIMAYLLFGMELLGEYKRFIGKIFAGIIVLLVVEFTLLLVVKNGYFWAQELEKAHLIVVLPWAALLLRNGLRNSRPLATTDRPRFMVNRAFLISVAAYPSILLSDLVLRLFGVPLGLNYRMDIVLPLFIGGLTFYTLSLIERRYQKVKQEQAKMEGDLAIAAKLQGIITPSELEGRAEDWSYAIESKAFGLLGGDWVKVHSFGDRSLFALGDVVGKGPSAALTHSGIAAIWDTQIRLWEKGVVGASDVMSAINSTMFGLFKGAMNTTFAAAEVGRDGAAQIAAGGNYWLHLGKEKCRLIPPSSRALLGIKQDLTVTFTKIELEPGDWLVCFTDGVLEGHRPIKRFFAAVEGKTRELTATAIREQLTALGSESVHPDDASILIIRYESSKAVAA